MIPYTERAYTNFQPAYVGTNGTPCGSDSAWLGADRFADPPLIYHGWTQVAICCGVPPFWPGGFGLIGDVAPPQPPPLPSGPILGLVSAPAPMPITGALALPLQSIAKGTLELYGLYPVSVDGLGLVSTDLPSDSELGFVGQIYVIAELSLVGVGQIGGSLALTNQQTVTLALSGSYAGGGLGLSGSTPPDHHSLGLSQVTQPTTGGLAIISSLSAAGSFGEGSSVPPGGQLGISGHVMSGFVLALNSETNLPISGNLALPPVNITSGSLFLAGFISGGGALAVVSQSIAAGGLDLDGGLPAGGELVMIAGYSVAGGLDLDGGLPAGGQLLLLAGYSPAGGLDLDGDLPAGGELVMIAGYSVAGGLDLDGGLPAGGQLLLLAGYSVAGGLDLDGALPAGGELVLSILSSVDGSLIESGEGASGGSFGLNGEYP